MNIAVVDRSCGEMIRADRAVLADRADGVDQAVRARGLCRSIDDRVILDDLCFEIPSGRFVALLGANGAGKSTLLRVLATLSPLTSGRLDLFGIPAGASAAGVRSRIGLVGHNSMLYRDLTAMENLVFFGRLYAVADPKSRARELLEDVGLSDRRDDPVKSYSRGMIQRVAIARALVSDPDLLLADEPFAGLDAPSQIMLESMLRRIHAQGRTILLANHDIAQSLELSEQTLVLRRGRLVLDGLSGSLDAASVLAEVVGP